MSNSNRKTHLMNIFCPKILSKIILEPIIFFNLNISGNNKILSYQHIWWTNKNYGLTISAVQIFLGLKILIATILVDDVQIVWTKMFFWWTIKFFVTKKTFRTKIFWSTVIFGGMNNLFGPNVDHGNKIF